MIIYPAIDLLDGEIVNLYQGDYEKKSSYGSDPIGLAQEFSAKGAEALHLVDLSGAKTGQAKQLDCILAIKEKSNLKIQVGGGIRSMETIDSYLEAGIDRVILGTVAVKNPELLEKALEKYGERIAVGVDVLDGKVAIDAWENLVDLSWQDFFDRLESLQVKTVICTDISKDGVMEGASIDLYRAIVNQYSMDIIASGGVSTMDDLRAIQELGLAGAIIGKALYLNKIDLQEAIQLARSGDES